MTLPDEVHGDRLHRALSATFERLHSAVPGASFERRAGHALLIMPAVPIALFNGIVVESAPCSGLRDSIGELEARGLPCGIQVRDSLLPDLEEELAELGFGARDPMPGMTVEPAGLADADVAGLEIERVHDGRGLYDAAAIVASAFGGPLPAVQHFYGPELIGLDGVSVYVGYVDGAAVTTAVGFKTGSEGGIFSVATPTEHRRRGYGAAVSAHAARELFARGADLCWLQASKLGEPVYRALGFRHVAMHFMVGRGGD